MIHSKHPDASSSSLQSRSHPPPAALPHHPLRSFAFAPFSQPRHFISSQVPLAAQLFLAIPPRSFLTASPLPQITFYALPPAKQLGFISLFLFFPPSIYATVLPSYRTPRLAPTPSPSGSDTACKYTAINRGLS